MAKTTVAIDLKATTSGNESVKSLKQEIKEAQQEAIALSRKFGEFSPEATKAAQKVAQLKDEMDDFRERVAGLHPDKFNRFATIANGITGGIQAATGALALFGDESEDVQKALVKVQGAMAFGQGVEQLLSMRNTLGAMAGEIKTKLVTAFTTAAGAARLLGQALGVGLLVTAVTWLVNNFDKVKQKVEDLKNAIPGLSTVLNALGNAWDWVKEKVSDFTDSIGITNTKLDALNDKMRKNIEFLKRAEEIDEALGKDTFESKRQRLLEEIKLLEQTGAKEEEIIAKRQELRTHEARQEKKLADEKAAAAKAAADAAAKAAEELKRQQNEIDNAIDAQYRKNRQERLKDDEQYFETEAKNAQNRLDTYIESDPGKALREYNAKQAKEQAEFKAHQDAIRVKKEQETEAAILAAKQAGYNASAQLFAAAADLAKEGSALQKGLALTSIAIDTAKAVSSTVIEARATAANYSKMGVPAPFPQIAAGAVYASGIAMVMSNIRRAKQLLNGGGGSFSPTGSTATPTAAPSFVPTTFGELPEEAGSMAGMGRVFVLEGDITRTQGRVRRLRNTSVV